jgi:biotin-(acetyl-CoA carboxylase) ligase
MHRLPAHGLELPPPFRPMALREVRDAFAHAVAHAEELGAGALAFVGRFDCAEFAVVLEPDEALFSARRVFFAGMIALCDALAAAAPPEKPIGIVWPDAISIDGGLVGGGRLAWPEGIGEDAVAGWLVFGAIVRTASEKAERSWPYPSATTLEAEGFADAGAERLIESFARHFMSAIDRWSDDGFAALGQEYLSKLKQPEGVRLDLAVNGDLELSRAGGAIEHRRLLPALARPTWLDQKTGEPHR